MLFGWQRSDAGVLVTEKTALGLPAVWACIRVIAEDTASLPLFLFERLEPRGKRRRPDHPLHPLLHDQPNPEMTALAFRETLTGHVLGWGNAYAYIVRDGAGRPIELWPLLPDRTWPRRLVSSGELVYETRLPPAGEFVRLRRDQVLHLAGLGFDGLMGYSPIRMQAQAIGLGLAMQEFGARFFGQGTNIGGVVEHPKTIGQPVYERLRDDLNLKYQGLGRSHLLMLLEEGMQFKQITVPPDEAQFVESRKFSLSEAERIYRMPAHKVQDLDRATFSNIEHLAIEYVTDTLRPWLVRWEQNLALKLLSAEERRVLFIEHVVEGLLRGDIATRYAAFAVGRQWGWLSVNDILEMENRNPIGPAGDVYLQPLNMAPVAKRLLPALRPMMEAGLRAMLQRERDRLLKLPKERLADGGWDRWLADLYDEHRRFLAERFMPACLSLGAAGLRIPDPVELARRHADESLREIRPLIEGTKADVVQTLSALDALTARWVIQRPVQIVDAILEESRDGLRGLH